MNPSFFKRTSASALSSSWETSMPSSTYVPLVGRSRQPIKFISVDLPEPDGPMIATYSPAAIVKVRPCSTGTFIGPFSYVLWMSRRSIASGRSFITQSLDGIQACGPEGGIGTERKRYDDGERRG